MVKKEFEDGLLRKGDIYKEFGGIIKVIIKVQIKLVEGEIEPKTGAGVNALNYLATSSFHKYFVVLGHV